MKRFVGGHFLALEIAGVVGGVVVGATQASVGVTYAIALLLLVVVLAIGFNRESGGGPADALRALISKAPTDAARNTGNR